MIDDPERTRMLAAAAALFAIGTVLLAMFFREVL